MKLEQALFVIGIVVVSSLIGIATGSDTNTTIDTEMAAVGIATGSDTNTTIDTEMAAIAKSEDKPFSIALWKIGKLFEYIFLNAEDGMINEIEEGRTFGKIRRLQSALIPLMFKFGILSAMISLLVLLGVKTFVIVKAILWLNIAALIAKLFIWKAGEKGHTQFQHIPWSAPAHKEVHVHIHNPHDHENRWNEHEHYGQFSSRVDQAAPEINEYPSDFSKGYNFIYNGRQRPSRANFKASMINSPYSK